MMKKRLLFSMICCLFLSTQPLMLQETAKPSAVLSWWRSLRRPTRQDLQKAKEYVNSKWRCLRYGEGCSRKERAKLGALAALVGVAVGATAWKAKKFIEKKRILKEESLRWLFYAFDGNFENIKKLIDAGIDVNIQDNNWGDTALIRAASYGHTEIVQVLLAVPGIEVNIQDNSGDTALMGAAFGGHTEIVRVLLKAPDIDVNKQNSQGDTALIIAAIWGRTDVVQLLLEAGADWTIKNKQGQTAFDSTANQEIKDMIDAKRVEGRFPG